MNYNEALSYIHSVCWQGHTPCLTRTQELLKKIGDPQQHLKFIHIAGTNGKGSTATMLSSILEASGYTVGLYTSPFINRFNERMQVNHTCIGDEELAELTTFLQPHADSMEEVPTEFEVITALAMEYFRRRQCDIVVLEVGLGGALDSTNVIDTPEAAIITAMGFDHVKELGSTMTEIAAAKAGIIKPHGDVVIYGQNPEAETVFERVCREQNATLFRPDYHQLTPGSFDLDGQSFSYKNWQDLRLPLVGAYQLNNAAVVLTAVEVLRKKGWHISDRAVADGLSNTRWPARFEILHRAPVFILDGGHNPHGIQATADSLRRIFPGKKFVFVTGVMADKDVEQILGLITPMASRFYTVKPGNPRAMQPDVLAQRIHAMGADAIPCKDVAEGVRAAMDYAGPDGVVCAIGSLYMSGEVRNCFPEVTAPQ